MSNDGYGIKFIIPDKPADEQLDMIKKLKKTMQGFADIANEPLDEKPFDDIIAQLETKIAAGDLTPLDNDTTGNDLANIRLGDDEDVQ